MEVSQLEDLFLERLERLCPLSSPLVVGVSGGKDSMALLTLLVNVHNRWPVRVVPVHVDHGIRPRSFEDALFVERTVRELLGLDVVQEHIQITPHRGESMEMAARRERYAVLEEHRRRLGPHSLIAVAHHRRDQAETVLMRVVNGTAIQGLQGMRAKNGNIIRPLLNFSPDWLYQYLQQTQVPWCEDESNLDTRFLRNRIRWELLPLLTDRLNPQIEEALAALAERAQESYALVHEETLAFLTQVRIHWDQDVMILPEEFGVLKTAVQADIFETVAETLHLRVNRSHILQAIKGQANWPGGVRISRDNKGQWVIIRHSFPGARHLLWPEQILPEQGAVDILPQGQLVIALTHFAGAVKGLVAIDKRRWPRLMARVWRYGDRIEPLGMKGHHKKVSDVFIDNKVPRHMRQFWPMIVSAEDPDLVLGIAGIMTAENARCHMGAICTQIRYVNEDLPF